MKDLLAKVRIREPEVAPPPASSYPIYHDAPWLWSTGPSCRCIQRHSQARWERNLSPACSFREGRSLDLPEPHQATLNRGGGASDGRGAVLPIQSSLGGGWRGSELALPLAPETTSCSVSAQRGELEENNCLIFDLSVSVAITPEF